MTKLFSPLVQPRFSDAKRIQYQPIPSLSSCLSYSNCLITFTVNKPLFETANLASTEEPNGWYCEDGSSTKHLLYSCLTAINKHCLLTLVAVSVQGHSN